MNNSQNKRNEFILSESDFYPPKDNRKLCSGIRDAYNGGENYDDYLEYFYETYGEDVWQDKHSLE
ncbi:MAG: hypothetical protein NC548_62635 [Lachnospiraceae bacterium]|nr:hypothetical protein [Lachnospiraceae bacterium]